MTYVMMISGFNLPYYI